MPEPAKARCHCGAVEIRFTQPPTELTDCNCSLCSSYGVLWTYTTADNLRFTPDPPPTDTYEWNGRRTRFHRCRTCGCVTHWTPNDPSRDRRGVNARLLPPEVRAGLSIRFLDGATIEGYVDDLPSPERTRPRWV